MQILPEQISSQVAQVNYQIQHGLEVLSLGNFPSSIVKSKEQLTFCLIMLK